MQTQATPNNDPEVLRKSLDNINSRLHKKLAEREMLVKQEANLVRDILMAKNRLAIKEEVKDTLDLLQNRSQEKSIGLFTNLLTAMVHDVQPKNKDQKIHFNLETKRGAPNLDIFMDVGGNNLEDISIGRGGSLTNIISAGLRYVTLSRTRNRRFIVLDEPDCWMNESSVPRFAKVISDISRKVGVQTIAISHKDASLYNSRIISIYRDPDTGRAKSKIIQESSEEDYIDTEEYEEINKTKLMDQVGIRKLTFRNFMSLEDVSIELSPTMNMIVGEGDIGKSAIFAGINAFANNSANASMITHGKPEFVIEIEIEDGIVLKMRHKRKGAKKTIYEMVLPDGEVISEENGKTLPDFIDEALGIRPVDGVNIQLAHQKEPPFMIGAHITSAKRAELLSLGRESDYIQQMITAYRESVKEDSKTVKDGEKEIKTVRANIDLLSGLDEAKEKLNNISQNFEKALYEKNTVQRIEEIANEIEKNDLFIKNNKGYKNLVVPDPYSVKLEGIDMLNEIISIGSNIKKNEQLLNKLQAFKNLQIPEIKGYEEIKENDKIVWKELNQNRKTINQAKEEMKVLEEELKKKNEAINQLVEDMGGICPLCQQEIKHTH